MDEEKTACCGRPLMQAGQYDAAQKLVQHNREQILASGAKILVVSCPICFKVFNEDYSMAGISVKHHSEYLLELMADKRIPVIKMPEKAVYHDPCELGRGSGIYHQPRLLIDEYINLIPMKHEKESAYCCGGSLANIKIQMHERIQITDKVLTEYQNYSPDLLITGCPLCKKTFAKRNKIPVLDLAEIVAMGIRKNQKLIPQEEQISLQKATII